MAQPEKFRDEEESYSIYRLDALQATWDVARLPYTLRILLENVLRNGSEDEVEAVAGWVATDEPSREISFAPARVLLQDFTGVPCVVDLAAMRDAMREHGGDPKRINPLIPAELVIDHSVQVDEFASRLAIERNVELEFHRNRERYAFLRWGQTAFDNFAVVPPNTGICHQVNLEFLARVVESRDGVAFPDTLVGTDSHTTMINGLGVLGWGVGGIEAEAAMLGESLSMLVPQVVGFKLSGALPQGSTATDLVLTVTQILRKVGVVRKVVEYFRAGVSSLALADRAREGRVSRGARLVRRRLHERQRGPSSRRHVPRERPDDRAAAGRSARARAGPGAEPCRRTRKEGGAGGGRGLLARARLRRDRRDHLVHEHVEPVG